MKPKKGFERKLTIDEMKKKQETKNMIQSKTDEYAHMIDAETDKAVVDVLKELGFPEAKEGMSLEEANELHAKMKEAGQYLNIATETVGSKHIVRVSVVQTARTLEFDLLGGDENDKTTEQLGG